MHYSELIEQKDKALFRKVTCSNILDLSLIIPNGYENRYLNKEILLNENQVLDIQIISLQKRAKTLQIQAICQNTNIALVIFNYKPFHLFTFKVNSRLFIFGKPFYNNINTLEISQPKVLKKEDIDCIYIKYNSKIARSLIEKYLNKENLLAYKINENIANCILQLHSPSLDFINKYKINGIYNEELKKYLYAIKFVEMFTYLLKMKSKKKDFLSIKQLDNNIDNWLHSLPFELTKDQQSSIEDIKKDFLSKNSSRRIVVGDVGCGKSIIIFASALIAYPNKSLLMAPTTVLAKQLYEEANKFLSSFMDIELITTNEKKISHKAHLSIGTHAILYKDFKDICLIMIDEQHKFGSNQRQIIEAFSKKGNKRAHFLQFSATPIPRTMAMIESSLIDFSFIKTTPFEKNIQTKQIFKKDFKDLIIHIKEQIANNHQIIIVYPLVEESQNIDYLSIQEAKDFWLERFEKVYVTFGADKNKDSVLQDFRNKGNILISTTVIEVGISLPKLSTIVIVGAERLGLASLHQLRGRVSRTGLIGYCFLYSNEPSKRVENFCNIKSGFDVAELDLRYRESGDIIGGSKQSGKMFNYINLSEDGEIVQDAKNEIEKHSFSTQ